MDMKDLFLMQHSAVHSKAVAGNAGSVSERTLGGVTDEQWRVRPREDLNSIAWIVWHVARAEDILVNFAIARKDQVFDEAWMKKLGISRRDFGIGMTGAEVSELTKQIDVAALRDYRDAVGRRTREIVGAFGPADWEGQSEAASLERAAAAGCFGGRAEQLVKAFTGRPRAALLSGIALFHAAGHLGEATTIRSAGGFGTGI
jgi:hypothetical protein